MIPNSDLEVLQSFDGRGNIMLSAYLQLDTPERRALAAEEFMQQAQMRLGECGACPECRDALQEDIEIVEIYLKTNGHRRNAGLAIFSCAAELFWRAYPLEMPVPTQVTGGSRFNVEPLLQHLRQGQPS